MAQQTVGQKLKSKPLEPNSSRMKGVGEFKMNYSTLHQFPSSVNSLRKKFRTGDVNSNLPRECFFRCHLTIRNQIPSIFQRPAIFVIFPCGKYSGGYQYYGNHFAKKTFCDIWSLPLMTHV